MKLLFRKFVLLFLVLLLVSPFELFAESTAIDEPISMSKEIVNETKEVGGASVTEGVYDSETLEEPEWLISDSREYIVGLKRGMNALDYLQKYPISNLQSIKSLKKNMVVASLQEIEKLTLMGDPNVVFVEENATVYVEPVGEKVMDENAGSEMKTESQTIPWGVHAVGGYLSQQQGVNGSGIKIAVLDTGVSQHADVNVAGGISFAGSEGYVDGHGHGTQVMGVIAASDNTSGILGVAPGASVYAVKVLGDDGLGTYDQVISGIEWAMDNEINIVSLSFAGDQYSRALHEVIKEATDLGMLVIAASGNNGGALQYPAALPEVVSVGAVNEIYEKASFSNFGSELDLTAPGVRVLSASLENGYAYMSGTSLAAPHVAGAAALLWSMHPDWNNVQVRQALISSASLLGNSEEYGSGIVNAAKALQFINGPIAPTMEEGSTVIFDPVHETPPDGVAVASYDRQGSGQTITAGSSASVSLKLDGDQNGNNPHSKINITVYPSNNPSNILASYTYNNPGLDVPIRYTWYTTSSTPAGTYTIRYSYPANSSDRWDDYFTIYVTQPQSTNPDTYEPNNSTSTATQTYTGNSYVSYISSNSDDDYFKFTAGATGSMNLKLYIPSSVDYDLYVTNAIGGSVGSGTKPAGQTEDFTIQVTAGSTYYVKVDGYSGGYSSSPYTLVLGSIVAEATKPPAPTGLRFTSATSDSVTMSWNALSTPVTSYVLERTGIQANYMASGTSYTFQDLSPNTSYLVRVAALNSEGLGDFSPQVSALTKPAIPSGLYSSSQTKDSITVKWNAVSGNGTVKYKLKRTGSTTVYETSGTSYTFTGLDDNQEYAIQVAASNNSGDSLYSMPIHPKTLAADLIQPSDLQIEVLSDGPVVANQTVTVRVSAKDNVQLKTLKLVAELDMILYKDEVVLHDRSDYVTNSAIATVSWTPTGKERTYKLVLNAIDASGNVQRIEKSVFVDKFRPVVLFVPGFFGTRIYEDQNDWNGDDEIWPHWIGVNKGDMDQLALPANGEIGNPVTYHHPTEVIEDPIGPNNDFTAVFLGSLRSKGIQVVEVPYDWRLNLDYAAAKVKSAVAKALGPGYSNGQPVTIIAHSTGGLPVRKYFVDEYAKGSSGDPNLKKVDNFISMGVPWLGTPIAMKGLTVGDDLGLPGINLAQSQRIVQNFTSIYTLLPSQKFVDIYHNAYQSGAYWDPVQKKYLNAKLDYNSFFNEYIPTGSKNVDTFAQTQTYIRNNHNATLYNKAFAFRTAIETKPIPSYITEYRFVGVGRTQTAQVIKYYDSGKVKYRGYWGQGDGVVPTRSADFNKESISSSRLYYFKEKGQHVALFENTALQNMVKQIVVERTTPSNAGYDSSVGDGYVRGYGVEINCPVDVTITDENGNKAYSADGAVINDIEGLSYEIWGESKLLFIPEELEVSIEIEGYDQGEMDIAFTRYYDEMPLMSQVLKDVEITPETVANFHFSGSVEDPSEVDVTYDKHGNGNVEILNAETTLDLDQLNDVAAPITTATVDGNVTNGWYSSIVTVSLTANDQGVSGINKTFYKINDAEYTEYTQPISIKGDGVYELTYYSLDKSGNKEQVQQQMIRIDSLAPDIRYMLDSEPNANGWHRSNVTITFQGSDDGSGIATITPQRVVSEEGSNIEVIGEAVDTAGNRSETSVKLNLDKTAPVSRADVIGLAGTSGWYIGPATVSLESSDSLSGVAWIEYRWNDGEWKKYDRPFTLSQDGRYEIEYRGIDAAGNTEVARSLTVLVDQTQPNTEIQSEGEEGNNDWFIGDIQVTLLPSDVTSGVVITEYRIDNGEWRVYEQPITVSSDGVYRLDFRSKDAAGLVEDIKTQTIRLDKSKPNVTANALPLPNEAGWNNRDITVSFSADDALSGIATLTSPKVISEEGNQLTVFGEAIDKAGNRATVTYTAKLDKTAPVTDAAINGPKGEDPWYVGDVTVTLSADDNLSGVSYTEYSLDKGTTWKRYSQPIVLTTDQVYTLRYRTRDIADNLEVYKETVIKLDKTAPTLKVTELEHEYYWNETVDVHFSAADNLSGIAILTADLNGKPFEDGSKLTLTRPGENVLTVKAVDSAGNETVQVQKFNVVIKAVVEFNPETIVLPKNQNGNKDKNSVVTVRIQLPSNFDAAKIDPASLLLNGMVRAQNHPISVDKSLNQLSIKFNRSEVEAILQKGDHVEIRIDGLYGTENYNIRGFDSIRVK